MLTHGMKLHLGSHLSAPKGDIFYRYAALEPAPRGVKLTLLTKGNQQVTGQYAHDYGYIAWSPLIKRDKALEAAIAETNGDPALLQQLREEVRKDREERENPSPCGLEHVITTGAGGVANERRKQGRATRKNDVLVIAAYHAAKGLAEMIGAIDLPMLEKGEGDAVRQARIAVASAFASLNGIVIDAGQDRKDTKAEDTKPL